MIRGSLRNTILSVGLLTLGAASGHAQGIKSPYRFLNGSQDVGVFAGHITSQIGGAGLGHESGNAFGVTYGFRFTGPLAIDINAIYFPSKYAVYDTTVTKTASDSSYKRIGTANSSVAAATASFRLNLTGSRTWHGVLPYVQGGAGGVFETSKDAAAIEKAPIDARFTLGTGFAATFGAGFEIIPADRLALRVDGRNVLWKIKAPAALAGGRLARLTPISEYVNHWALTAGVLFHF